MTSKPTRAGVEEAQRPRLGRGLAALLADAGGNDPDAAPRREQTVVAVEFLRPNPRNPRRQFSEGGLRDLTESIRARGIIQPIVVREIRNVAGSYEIIAGERRWRAAQAAALTEVPVVVVEADDREALAFAIIENVQRADLNAIEEARGYERLAHEFGYSHAELSAAIGKSRSHVANTVRLLKLPEAVSALVEEGRLSAGHARALLAFEDPAPLAKRIVTDGLTVRDVEHLAQRAQAGKREPARRARTAPSADGRALAQAFSAALGLHVTHRAKDGAGEFRIRYASGEELDGLRKRFGVKD